MNATLIGLGALLAAMHLLAIGYWIASLELKLVVATRRELGAWRNRSASFRRAIERLGALGGWSRTLQARLGSVFRRGAVAQTEPVAQEAPPTDQALEDWIREVEQSETPAATASASTTRGSDAWWKLWADSGGIVPAAADSDRSPAVPSHPMARSPRNTAAFGPTDAGMRLDT